MIKETDILKQKEFISILDSIDPAAGSDYYNDDMNDFLYDNKVKCVKYGKDFATHALYIEFHNLEIHNPQYYINLIEGKNDK